MHRRIPKNKYAFAYIRIHLYTFVYERIVCNTHYTNYNYNNNYNYTYIYNCTYNYSYTYIHNFNYNYIFIYIINGLRRLSD